MAAKIAEMVRNSPLGRRKAGGYSPVQVATEDPFVQGISFNAHFVTTIESPDRVGSELVQNGVTAAIDDAQKSGKPFRKVVFVVKAVSITIRDVANKKESTFPIYLVSYCGNSRDVDTVFFFLQKSKQDRIVRAEIFKCESSEKVTAITRTVSKAFNVAYKAWCTKKRMEEKKAGVNSPLLRRTTAADAKKTALGAVKGGVSEFYTPPIPRRASPQKEAGVRRSGSFGSDKRAAVHALLPDLRKVQIHNEQTGEVYIHICDHDRERVATKVFILIHHDSCWESVNKIHDQ